MRNRQKHAITRLVIASEHGKPKVAPRHAGFFQAGDPSRRQQMAREMSNFAQPDAALQIAKLVQGTLGNNSRAAA